MAFRVEISAQAERDADAILEWLLSQHTGQAGVDWFLALDDVFASLAEFPERCPIAPESARHAGLRKFTKISRSVMVEL
jgi:plasmid stabilization system protein ParE